MKPGSATIVAFSLTFFANLASHSQTAHQDKAAACIASLSGFPKDNPATQKPEYPSDISGVTLEYFASGCYGNCPAFTLTISKGTAVFQGHDHVRAKGKRTAKLTSEQFDRFLRAWYDGSFYAMRDDYCSIHCDDGTVIIVTDVAESSITLTTPKFKKRIYECFSGINGKPQTPEPPKQYFELSRSLLAFAKAQHWL